MLTTVGVLLLSAKPFSRLFTSALAVFDIQASIWTVVIGFHPWKNTAHGMGQKKTVEALTQKHDWRRMLWVWGH